MLLKLENVSVRYKNASKNAVNNVSFTIDNHEIVSLVGHNGAGKSTLIQAIMQNLDYDGTISYGFDSKDLYRYVRVQTQTSTFEKGAKVKDIVQLYIDLLNESSNVDELLDSIQMGEFKDSYLESLSGGEKQKVAVLLATIGNPKLIILDELTTGLDAMSRRMIWDLLNKIRDEKGVSILLTSHFLDEVEYLSDYVVVLEQGGLKLEGSVLEIINEAFTGRKRATCLVDAQFDFAGLNYEYKQEKNMITINYTKDEEQDVYNALRQCGGFDVQLKQHTFEDAFLKIIGYQLEGGNK